MESGDGLIVRISTGFAGLTAAQLFALAELARVHGNGIIELTRRANLQLRGVRADSLALLQRELVAQGLVDPQLRDAPALLCDPLAGLDPRCAPIDALVGALERLLRTAVRALGLPPKFGIVVDAGSGVLARVSADVRLSVAANAPGMVHVTACDLALGACPVERIDSVLQVLLVRLGRFAAETRARLGQHVAALGASMLRDGLGLRDSQFDARQGARCCELVGHHEPNAYFGLGIPFGSGSSETWFALAGLADRFSAGALRLCTERAVLLPDVSAASATELALQAERAGLIVCATDPLLRAHACAGAPACQSAWGETRQLARSLARDYLPLLAADASLHVSGCTKACAGRAPASLTLVHAADGCRLGFACDVAQLAAAPAQPLATVLERLAARPEAR